MDTNGFNSWCVVELFGHYKIAGRVSEHSIAGATFLRVDVPAVACKAGYTKFYGNGAVYALTPVTEAVARAVAAHYYEPPVSLYEIRALAGKETIDGDNDSTDDNVIPDSNNEDVPF